MKQFTSRIYDAKELDRTLLSLKTNTQVGGAGALLFTVFTCSEFESFIRKIQQAVGKNFPEALLVGISTSGEIFRGRLSDHSIILSLLCFEKTEVEVLEYDCSTLTEEKAGKQLLEAAAKVPQLAGIEILATVKSIDVKSFLEPLDALDAKIPIFGGGADSYNAERDPILFGNKNIYKKGVAAVLFKGRSLSFFADFSLGWKQIGRRMRITGIEGNTKILELDCKPAFTIYEKYLRIENDSHFGVNTSGFPLIVNRDGFCLARAPFECDKNGALSFSGDFAYGEKTALSYGNPNSLIVSSRELRDRMEKFEPDAIFIFDCISRRTLLEDDVNDELLPFEEVTDTTGFFTYGEIVRLKEKTNILNCSMVAVGFREGSRKNRPVHLTNEKEHRLGSERSLVQRLATFIDVTTQELEEANEKLAELARRDRLTELLNRGEIEERIGHAAAEFATGGEKFSLIMADLDFFKAFNDQYGHEIGDLVLKKFSGVLMKSTRGTDAVGRWGGEEFMIVLYGQNINTAVEVAERIRMRLSNNDMEDLPKEVTVSLGVTEVRKNDSLKEIYKRVDRALYNAKALGRNRTEKE